MVISRRRTYAGLAQYAPAARRFVAAVLADNPLRADAALVTAELVSNALLHSRSGQPGGTLTVRVTRRPRLVRITVTDQGSAAGDVRWKAYAWSGGLPPERGWGLTIVGHLATSWGVRGDGHSATFFAVLTVPEPK